MVPDAKICWFCIHQKSEWRKGKKERLVRYCELGKKNLNVHDHQEFKRCSHFEPEEARITEREQRLRKVMTDCAVELRYLERLRYYMNCRNQSGAEYERRFAYHNPLVRADDEELKPVSADGFEGT